MERNIILSGIPDATAENQLESAMMLIRSDIEVTVQPRDFEDCYRIGKPDRKIQRKLSIIFSIKGRVKKPWKIKRHTI